MSPRKRPTIFWIHAIHRWLSIVFVIGAVLMILPILPHGPLADAVSTVTIAALLLLAITGIWEGVHHYTVKLRAPRRRRERHATAPTGV